MDTRKVQYIKRIQITSNDFTAMFNELLLACMPKPNPMLHLFEWLCTRLMEAEVNEKLDVYKNGRADAPVTEGIQSMETEYSPGGSI